MINLIDTVKLRYTISDSEEITKLVQWIGNNYSESYTELVKINGAKSYRCNIKNLKILIHPNYLYIAGSLQKFYLGNNANEMTLANTYEAFEHINSSLGNIINIKQANITRLDIGANIQMVNTPTAYISKLNATTINKPTFYNGQTISTGNQSRGMIIYDKTVESKKDAKRNNYTVGNNIIRLEATLKGRKVFEKRFGHSLPTVNELLDQLCILPEIWYEEYKRLHKEYSINIDRITSQKDLFNYAVTQVGFNKIKFVIDYSYDLNLISKQAKYRYYRTIKSVSKNSVIDENDLMKELDDKVEIIYKKAKGNC